MPAENFKYGAKTRGIHTADDISREALSEVDRNTNRIATDVKTCFTRAGSSLKPQADGNSLTDLSKWELCCNIRRRIVLINQYAARDSFSGFSENLVGMCFVDHKLILNQIWRNMPLGVNRRGYSAHNQVTDGCVMGWTTDKILHE